MIENWLHLFRSRQQQQERKKSESKIAVSHRSSLYNKAASRQSCFIVIESRVGIFFLVTGKSSYKKKRWGGGTFICNHVGLLPMRNETSQGVCVFSDCLPLNSMSFSLFLPPFFFFFFSFSFRAFS